MNEYTLLYRHGLLPSDVAPQLSVDNLVNECNQVLSIPRDQHHDGMRNNLARMARLNWMVENLKTEKIVKPLVLRLRQFKLEVVTGDTRLMALDILNDNNPRELKGVLSIETKYRDQFPDWTEVNNLTELADGLRFPESCFVLPDQTNWKTQELDWMEFDLAQTSNHMHDEDQRIRMIYNYIDCRQTGFLFDRLWFTTPIDWHLYDF